MEAGPGGDGRSLQALLQGSAREHATLAALVAGSSLRSRAECAPLPPLSFADAQRLAEGRDGRQRGREGKTKLPVKGILAGPPDTSAFWHFAEVPALPPAHAARPAARRCARRRAFRIFPPDPRPAVALPPSASGSTGGGAGLLLGRGARGPGGADRRARRPARRPDLRGAAGRAAARRRARGGAGGGRRRRCGGAGRLAAPARARARRGAARAGGRRRGAPLRLGPQSPSVHELRSLCVNNVNRHSVTHARVAGLSVGCVCAAMLTSQPPN
jgi:hypothetical protein